MLTRSDSTKACGFVRCSNGVVESAAYSWLWRANAQQQGVYYSCELIARFNYHHLAADMNVSHGIN